MTSMDVDTPQNVVAEQQPEVFNFSLPAQETVEQLPSSSDGKMISWATDAAAITSALALPNDTVTVSQSVDASGNVVVTKTKELTVSQAYQQHVQLHGRRIQDSEEHDVRLYTALSVAQSLGGNPEMADRLQRITTKEELDAYFVERNNAGDPVTHMLDELEKKAEERGEPLKDPMQDPSVLEMIRSTVQELEKKEMLEDAPDVKLEDNTIEARVAKIRELQEQGNEIIISNPSKELREALGLDDDNARYKEICEQSDRAQAAIAAGLRTANTLNPSDPQQAQALAEQVHAAALLLKKKKEGENPITRCDRTTIEPSKKSDKFYWLAAKDFSNDMEKYGYKCRRLDTVAPVAPNAAAEMLDEMMDSCLRTEFFATRMEVLVHPAKLFLLLTGSQQPKMMNFSDVRMFYVALLVSLGGTNMRPTEQHLRAIMKEKDDKLNADLAKNRLAAQISREPKRDEHMEIHSKERIATVQQTTYGEACIAFMTEFSSLLRQVKREIPETTKQFLREVYNAQRRFCVETLHSLELAVMLYFEDSIPVAARSDLMTSTEEACEHCTSNESKSNVVARREWQASFRRKTFLVDESQFAKNFDLSNLVEPDTPNERVDLSRSWSPTYKDMWEFVRFVAIKLTTRQMDEFQEKAQRWAVKYMKETMKPSTDFVSKLQQSNKK